MRSELITVLNSLLQASEKSRTLTLDEMGDALGVLAVRADEIDELMAKLEANGRRIVGPTGGGGESRLKVVITVARLLHDELGRKPKPAEIAARADMSEEHVRHALALARVMGR